MGGKATVLWRVGAKTGGIEFGREDGGALTEGRIPLEVRELGAKQAAAEAGALIQAGELVAFPTETVYGLGASVRSVAALRRVFEVKGRPPDNPLIAHVCSAEQVEELSNSIPPLALELMARFWPGPLTVLLPARPDLPRELTAGLPDVAVRMPNHPLALEFIKAAGVPVAGPSANRSGRPSPTEARHVLEDFLGEIAGVLDGGPCRVGIESTVVAVEPGGVVVLRPGAVGERELAGLAGASVRFDPGIAGDPSLAPRSPGQKYRHYAPRAPMTLFAGENPARIRAALAKEVGFARLNGRRVAVLYLGETFRGTAEVSLSLGSRERPEEAASRLYAALRTCDRAGVDWIVAEGFPETPESRAVMNRLLKAAGGRAVTV